MPKVISFTPPWLSRPSPGASIFLNAGTKHPETSLTTKNQQYAGPKRIQAKRGNELFTVVNNQIRWSDLTRVKDEWQHQTRRKNGSSDTQPESEKSVHYKILLTPVHENIRQLIPSPNGAFLAIVADHTVFIAVLPDPSHLAGTDTSPIRIKTYQLGPTTHVIPESPVVSALWHPLGLHSNLAGCLVTVTEDAAVRVWEIDRNNHWSFDRPTLAVDLRKLIDGTSCDQDYAPSGFGRNKGFSADYIDMEVASAAFGGTGTAKEDAWAPMTLWVAMRPGDLYALCPLLPTKWRAPLTTVPALSTAILPKLASLQEDPAEYEDELAACRQQFDWLTEIDNQEPLLTNVDADYEVRTRPAAPSAIPKMQGPFRFDTGDEIDDLDLCDILVVAARADLDALMVGEEVDLVEAEGKDRLSATVICLSSGSGRIYVCLELDGVEGQWLPKGRQNVFRTPVSDPCDLLLVESLDTVKTQADHWPTFTKDVYSRYNFFVTTATNVTFFSLSSWVQRLDAELQSEDATGSAFRLQVLCEGTASLREQLIEVDDNVGEDKDHTAHLPASLVYYDYDLGYLLLTSRGSVPYAAILDAPEVPLPSIGELQIFDSQSQGPRSPVLPPRRPPYQVPPIFYSESPLDSFVDKHVPHRQRQALKEQVRLSPATLDLVAAAHRSLSAHTNALERAASDLFRRCERLQGEMRDQLKQLADVADRVRGVSSELGEDGKRIEGSRNAEALDKRLQAAKDRQAELVQRYEALRSKVMKSGGRPLSDKEKAWFQEVERLCESFGDSARDSQPGQESRQAIAQRLETAKDIARDMLAEAKSVAARLPALDTSSPASAQPTIPYRLQRTKVGEAMRMVERESAIIESITSRLDRLNTTI
ncbi:uncharacterized protein BP01DRAFT_422918 [Aspergillus saccharolyticus JOP 1030-1]|uniref:Nuclear pore complex protein An-Nup82 n=1 Tax=Aspergillus saccharolyticus JOP 1030-1 TaxID=1450539 RepID=A0A318ZGI5_9EURO|nr:nuclear pore complex protein An-Nup82 [Aspergillus saccharolyticus JOP 1030-1]PYH45857.1 nuclear pore complex protein An-Nup82 [Aspergillus saccharolyticus JOP 1030-1]